MTDSHSPCSGCSGRRDFLRTALTGAASIAALSALGPVNAISALVPRAAGGAVRYTLPAVDGVSIDSANEVILCRSHGEVFAFALSCPHQNTALKTMPKNAGFQCPRHKSKYLPNGTFVSGRATRNMDRLPITRDGVQIVVDPDVALASDLDPAKWAAALVKI
ncbi:ubiquinol-cytochrome c reductase iron-sulfur subunit [Gemmatimonas sp.]|uniref:QcrA and Rieske domain-containing protein n=1 Tax=Gemmatimonas sp. TaxID=1962908 RepID=UPI0039831463